MSDHLRELYQEVIIDHGRRPRNFSELSSADRIVDGYNPLCGDKIKLFVKFDNNAISDISFTGVGCAISMASCSLMTEALKGKTLDEAKQFFNEFHRMLTKEDEPSAHLAKLAIFAGVKEFPSRVKCATLGWHTMINAIEGNTSDVASTE